jgi:acyl transferase domain-containing protein/NADP-dependent 3-hydroxy acid dehydrogenase YdfG
MTALDPDSHIAIVGYALDFPQAATPEQFWDNLMAARCAVEDLDAAALAAAGVDPAEAADPAYVASTIRLADFDRFDAGFFGLSPREAAVMDPQHRRFLQCAWAALEHAGYRTEAFERQTGVFAGCGMGWYLLRNVFGHRELLADMGEFLVRHLNNDKDFLATRVSYAMDLRGPSLSVQTACSTSLVAVHLACQSLLSGECAMALAGGSTIEVPQGVGYLHREEEIRSRDGRCRAFDADSTGTAFGSGCGLVVLKRLGDALRDGDSVHAVIRATAINNDGAGKAGYLAPSVGGQAEAVTTALTLAGVEADSIGYVEAHGTGTKLGDVIEVGALSHAFEGAALQGCGLGSVKASIGHLDTAAGVAGLIKTALLLEHGQLPPSALYRRPNPEIDFAATPFFVVDAPRDWPKPGPRRAALNSLGVGGTNAFAVLEQAPAQARAPQAADTAYAQPLQLLLSARTNASLRTQAAQLAAHLRGCHTPLADIAFTLREGRVEFGHRIGLAARSRAEAAAQLDALVAKPQWPAPAAAGAPRLVFAFPGQGAQRLGMARGLYAAEPAVRAAVDACCEALRGLGREDVVELLLHAEDAAAEQAIRRTENTQPLLFCIEYALAQGLIARELAPSACVGHSLGEYVAATLAGVFELPAAIELICTRGRLCAQAAEGAMLAVALSREALAGSLPERIDIAGINAPQQTVLAGPRAGIEALAARLESEGASVHRLATSAAFHSSLLDPLLDEFRAAVRRARPQPSKALDCELRIASTLHGDWLAPDQAGSAEYWVRHLREPVDFRAAQACLAGLGEHVQIEVGPGRTLSRLAQACSPQARALTTLGEADAERELDAWFGLGAMLWAQGAALDVAAWQQPRSGRRVPLPTYVFARDRHWIEPAVAVAPQVQAKSSGLGDWLQAQDWVSAPLPRPRDEAEGAPAQGIDSVLLLSDAGGIGNALAERLRARGLRVRCLARGGELDLEGESLCIDPRQDAHWQALAALPAPSHLIDLWALDAVDAPESVQLALCFDWPLRMLQALEAWTEREGGLAWMSVGVNAQNAGDPLALEPEQALRAGPVRTWPQEAPGVRSAWIDLDGGHLGSSGLAAELLLAELLAGLPDETVAWRGRRRLRPQWTSLGLARLPEHAALKAGGRYLVAGAFGGAGEALVGHLARLPEVELILIAHSELPEDPAHPRRRWLQALEQRGAKISVWVVDLADPDALEACARAQGLDRLDGAFHAAGSLDDGLIARKSLQAAHRVLAPKRAGAKALASLAESCNAGFVLYFSSLSAQMGAAGQVDYTAANAWLDAFAAFMDASSSQTRHIALAFSVWREVGMAARLAAAQGLAPAALAHALPQPHPLLKQRRDEPDGRSVFAGVVEAGSDWVLDQHRLRSGEALLPGTGFLDLVAYALAARCGGFTPFACRELTFAAPFLLAAGERRRLELSIEHEGEQGWRIEVHSQGAADDDRIEHLSARFEPVAALPLPEPLAPAEDLNELAPSYRHPELHFGPQWNCLRRLAARPGRAELELELADDSALEGHPLHPGLFDMAIGAAQAALAPVGIDVARLLPFRYGRLQVLAPLPAHVLSRQRARAEAGNLVLDVDLFDAQGERVLALRDFVLKPARALATAPARKPAAAASAILEVGFRDGFDNADAIAAIEAALGHEVPAQLALARRAVAELVEATRHPPAPAVKPAAAVAGAEVQRGSGMPDFVAPQGELQQRLVALWEGLLDLRGIGIEDDFFALGGHSLLLTRALSRLKREQGLVLPVEPAFETPTISAWSALAAQAAPAPKQPALKRVDRSRYRAVAADG